MSGCKIPEGKNEENCYRIWITGECDFLIVSPDMIAVLIAKMRRSDTREMTVPSEEVLPPEYAEYLTRVMEANEDGTRTVKISMTWRWNSSDILK